MPERHTKRLGIDVGQLRQDIGVDLARAKERLMLAEAETFEPTPDIHARATGPERIVLRLKHPVQGGLSKDWVRLRSTNRAPGPEVNFRQDEAATLDAMPHAFGDLLD